MNRHPFKYWIVLFQFQSFGRILLVLGRYIPGGARLAAGFMLCAFHDHLYTRILRFLCHNDSFWVCKINVFIDIYAFRC